MNWVTSGVTLPSFLDKSSCSEFNWLTYMILWLEGNFEIDSKLWPTLQEEMLNNPKAGAEHCLKVNYSLTINVYVHMIGNCVGAFIHNVFYMLN